MFRKSFSMNSYLTLLTDKISKGFKSRKCKDLILIDLQKTFGTIYYEIFLKNRMHWIFGKSNFMV